MDGNKMPQLAPRMFGFNFLQQEETETRRPSVFMSVYVSEKSHFSFFGLERTKPTTM